MVISNTLCTQTYLPVHVKNSTSLTANLYALPDLTINIFVVLKLTLMLTFLRPADSSPGGTASMSAYLLFPGGVSQTSKSSGAA